MKKEQEHVKNIDINIKNYQKKCDEIEQYLEENKSTEIFAGQVKKSADCEGRTKEKGK